MSESYKEIGRCLKISDVRVKQIETKALIKMRDYLASKRLTLSDILLNGSHIEIPREILTELPKYYETDII